MMLCCVVCSRKKQQRSRLNFFLRLSRTTYLPRPRVGTSLERQSQKSMASNTFHALEDSDSESDDEDSVFKSDADKLEKKANNLFLQAFAQNQTFSFSAQAAKETTLAGVKNQGESSLSSMANVLDSLGDDVKQLTRRERPNVVKKRWNFDGLSNVVHSEKQPPSTQRENGKYNPLLRTTINNHERNVSDLMNAIKSKSKHVNTNKKSRKNDKMFRSRAANRRKARKLSRGEAYQDKAKYKVGKSRRRYVGQADKNRKIKSSPY